jgi:hypothetical protein
MYADEYLFNDTDSSSFSLLAEHEKILPGSSSSFQSYAKL